MATQSWLAPYDGGSTVLHYEVEVSEFYQNVYVVYDDSRCAPPAPAPVPAPSPAGRRRRRMEEDSEAAAVACENVGGRLLCGEHLARRRMQDVDEIPQTAWNETSRVALSLPVSALQMALVTEASASEMIAEGSAGRATFERQLLAELNRVRDQSFGNGANRWTFQRTNDNSKATCEEYEGYEYITREEAKVNVVAICDEGNRLLTAASNWIAAVGQRQTPGTYTAPGIKGTPNCVFAEDGCLVGAATDICGDPSEGFSVCKLDNIVERFRIVDVYDPGEMPGQPGVPAENGVTMGTVVSVIVDIEVADSESEPIPGFIVDTVVAVLTGTDATLVAGMTLLPTAAQVERQYILPEPEPLPSPEPDPDFTITRTDLTVNIGSVPGDWNATFDAMVGGMGLMPSCTPGAAAACVESKTFGVQSVRFTILEPAEDEAKYIMEDLRTLIATLYVGYNVTTVSQANVYLDTSGPDIALFGDNPMTIEQYTRFTEPGATAFDNMDGDVTVDMIITGSVDMEVAGDYFITYAVVDRTGNLGQVVRTVVVNDPYAFRQGAPRSDEPGGSVVSASVTLDMDFALIDPADASTAEQMTAFRLQFLASVHASLGLQNGRVTIDSIVAGSVVVAFSIAPDSSGLAIDLANLLVFQRTGTIGNMVVSSFAITGAPCEFMRTVIEEGIIVVTGRDGRRYARATRPTKTWEWPYVIPESYYTSNLRQNRSYVAKVRAVSAVGKGEWTDNWEFNTPAGNEHLDGVHIFGCQDPMAFNYNARATYGDGSCVFEMPITRRPCFATYAAVCASASMVLAVGNGDQMTCEGQAGWPGNTKCLYTPDAVDVNGVQTQFEACAAIDVAVCEAVAQDSNQATCIAAGDCTWDPRLSQAPVHGWDGDDGSVYSVGGTRGAFGAQAIPTTGNSYSTRGWDGEVEMNGRGADASRTGAAHQDQHDYVYPLQNLEHGAMHDPPNGDFTQGARGSAPFEITMVPDNGTESGRDDYTDYPTYQNPTAGGGPGEGIEGLQQYAREARQRGDFYSDSQTTDHGPWETWAGQPGNSSHTVTGTGPGETLVDGGNIHSVFATADQESTTNFGTDNYGDQAGPGPEKWNINQLTTSGGWQSHPDIVSGNAFSGQQAFQLAAQLRAETIQEQMRNTRSDDAYRLVHGEPWGHRPGYGGRLGGGDPDLDLASPWSSGTNTHPTGIPRRLRDPEYRIHHGLAARNLKTPWKYNMTIDDIKEYREIDVNTVRVGFQWDPDEPDWNALGRRYMTFRACVEALNATALNSTWVQGYENVSTHLDRVAGPDYHQGPIGYGNIADTGLDESYIPTGGPGASEGRVNDPKLLNGLIGDHSGRFQNEHDPSVGQGHGPTTYYERWGGGPLPEPEPEPAGGGGFVFVPVNAGVSDRVMPIAQGLLNEFTSCDESMVTVHIYVEDWGEDVLWQVDGGTIYGPYANKKSHYFEALYLTAGEHNFTFMDRRGNGWCSPTFSIAEDEPGGPLTGWDRTGPDGVPLKSGCGYWDVADDTARVLSGGPVAGIVHGRGDTMPFIVPSRCATGTQVGERSRPGHRVSSAWNFTEYNSLMEYCQERVYINCSITPEHCTFYINETDGSWLRPPQGNYWNDTLNPGGHPLGDTMLENDMNGIPVNFLLNDADVEGYDFSKLKEPMQGPEFTNRPYHDRSAEYTGAETPMYDPQFGAIPHTFPEMGAEQNHRMDPLVPTSVTPPGDDPDMAPSSHGSRTDPRTAFVSNHHDGPAFSARPLVHYENAGIWPGSRSGTSVEYEPGYTPGAYVPGSHVPVAPSYYQTGLGHEGGELGVDGSFTYGAQVTAPEHPNIWPRNSDQSDWTTVPGSIGGAQWHPGSGTPGTGGSANPSWTTGTGNDASTTRTGHDGGNYVNLGRDPQTWVQDGRRRRMQTPFAEVSIEEKIYRRKDASATLLQKSPDDDIDHLNLTDRHVRIVEEAEMRLDHLRPGERWELQLGALRRHLSKNYVAAGEVARRRMQVGGPEIQRRRMQFHEEMQYIPDSVFNGQIWPVGGMQGGGEGIPCVGLECGHGYKPKATAYPPNPGYTDAQIVGLRNDESSIIPDSQRANDENEGFYGDYVSPLDESWHGVSRGTASPQTTTNPWWMDEWASGGQPSQDLARDLTMENILIGQRDGGFFGQDGVYGLYMPGATGADTCDWAKDGSCDEPTTLTHGIIVQDQAGVDITLDSTLNCLVGTDATDCRAALQYEWSVIGSQGQPRAAAGDQFDGGTATHWLGPWPGNPDRNVQGPAGSRSGAAGVPRSGGTGPYPGTGLEDGSGPNWGENDNIDGRITGYPDRDYVDSSQNTEYSDRLDATTGVMFTSPEGLQRETEVAIGAYMDQLLLRDMAFEDMMEARRELERLRLFKEARARAIARARGAAEDLAKLRGHGIRRHLWDWIREDDVGPDGDLADPLYCHGLSYEQCQYKVHRQDFIAIEGSMVNMTEYLFANNLTANYSQYVYQGDHIYIGQQTVNAAVDYGSFCVDACPGGLCHGGDPCVKDSTIYVGDTLHFSWQLWDNVHVAYYYEDPEEVCPASLRTPMCPIGTPGCHANYFESGDVDGDPSNDPDRILFGSYEHYIEMGDATQVGTYCIGSRGNSAANVALTLRVLAHPCDASEVGRGSPCDPPSPNPLCNATLQPHTHVKYRSLTGLQQKKLDYIWMQNFSTWDKDMVHAGNHDGKYTGYHSSMPSAAGGGVSVSDFGTGIFTGVTEMRPGYIYNATKVPPVYVNYTTIPGFQNLTENEWHEEEYINGTWLNETWVCQDEVTLIPDRQPCWVGYFKRQSNTGIHNGHASGDSFACLEPSNIYDTVAPYYYDQLNEWKDTQLMYPPIVWELVETLEARGVKVILDSKKDMEAENDPYPLCGYGVKGGFQSFSDIYACFVPTNQPSNLRRRFSAGDWNRDNWGYEKRFAPGDPAYARARSKPTEGSTDDAKKGELDSEYYRRSSQEFHDAREPNTVPRRRTNPKQRPYAYPDYVRDQQAQSYYDDLRLDQGFLAPDMLYIPGSENAQAREELLGGPLGPQVGTAQHHEIISGGDFVNPQGTYGYDPDSPEVAGLDGSAQGTWDHDTYADAYPYTTDYGEMLGKDERRRP